MELMSYPATYTTMFTNLEHLGVKEIITAENDPIDRLLGNNADCFLETDTVDRMLPLGIFISGDNNLGKGIAAKNFILDFQRNPTTEHGLSKRLFVFEGKSRCGLTPRKETDLVFNPHNQKSIQITLMNNISNKSDVDTFAYAIFPNIDLADDDYSAARNILMQIIHSAMQDGLNDGQILTNTALNDIFKSRESISDFQSKHCADNDSNDPLNIAAADLLIEKMAFLELIKDMDGDFSFKQWAEHGTDSLYVSMPLVDDSSSYDALYAVVFEFGANALLSLSDIFNIDLIRPDMLEAMWLKSQGPEKRLSPVTALVFDGFIDDKVYLPTLIECIQRSRSKGIYTMIIENTKDGVVNLFNKNCDGVGYTLSDNINTFLTINTQSDQGVNDESIPFEMAGWSGVLTGFINKEFNPNVATKLSRLVEFNSSDTAKRMSYDGLVFVRQKPMSLKHTAAKYAFLIVGWSIALTIFVVVWPFLAIRNFVSDLINGRVVRKIR